MFIVEKGNLTSSSATVLRVVISFPYYCVSSVSPPSFPSVNHSQIPLGFFGSLFAFLEKRGEIPPSDRPTRIARNSLVHSPLVNHSRVLRSFVSDSFSSRKEFSLLHRSRGSTPSNFFCSLIKPFVIPGNISVFLSDGIDGFLLSSLRVKFKCERGEKATPFDPPPSRFIEYPPLPIISPPRLRCDVTSSTTLTLSGFVEGPILIVALSLSSKHLTQVCVWGVIDCFCWWKLHLGCLRLYSLES